MVKKVDKNKIVREWETRAKTKACTSELLKIETVSIFGHRGENISSFLSIHHAEFSVK